MARFAAPATAIGYHGRVSVLGARVLALEAMRLAGRTLTPIADCDAVAVFQHEQDQVKFLRWA